MKFSDLFVPRYMHSNADVRLQSVERLEDARLLEQIAEKDADARVRTAAAKRAAALKGAKSAA